MGSQTVFEVVIPKENASDDMVAVVECLFQDGSFVQTGDSIGICENSKTAFDIETDKGGYIFYLYEPGENVAVGAPFAVISDAADFSLEGYLAQAEERKITEAASGADSEDAVSGKVAVAEEQTHFSMRAQALLQQQGLSPGVFSGQGFVTESDVIAVVRKSSSGQSANERAPELVGYSASDVVIFGGGGHGKMCIDLLQAMGGYRIIGIVDSDLPLNSLVLGIPVIGREADFPAIFASGVRNAVLGIGAADKHPIREKLFNKLKSIGFRIPNLIHPRAAVERSAMMGEGNQIMANAIVGSCVRIGHNCIVNSGAIVSHDSVLEDNVHVSPGAALAGWTYIGANSLIGMNAAVYMKVRIGQGVTVFNGVSVLMNVEPGSVVR